MLYSDNIDEKTYTDLMNQIKKLNSDWLLIRKSKEYRIGLVFYEILTDVKKCNFRTLYKSIGRWRKGAKSRKIKSEMSKKKLDHSLIPNYFCNERIAVYTAIYGAYDHVPEPYCLPDNCDFFLFTDQQYEESKSAWIVKETPSEILGLSNVEKNRYLKMHPHKILENYKYSVYIDGNVQVITDLTEYVNVLGKVGLGIHMHDTRSCVYDELEAIGKTGRESKKNIERHTSYLKKTGMPKNYGLLQCNIIVRENNNPVCIKIMEDWWKEFFEYTKRDQISLPHVLYRHGVTVSEVGVLGNSVYKNPSFRVINHIL